MSIEVETKWKEVFTGMALERREKPKRKYRVRCDGLGFSGRCYKRGPWRKTKDRAKEGAMEKGFTYHAQGIVLCEGCKDLAKEFSTVTPTPSVK